MQDKSSEFIHLKTHSHYSLLKALPQITDLVKKAKELKMPALALTDYNNMYGAIEFYNLCRKEEIKPILGVEFDIKENEHPKTRKFKITLLVKDEIGYKILMRLVSVANTAELKDVYLTKETLKQTLNQEREKWQAKEAGLILLTGGIEGEISVPLAKENFAEANKIYTFYQEVFGEENVYLEIENHLNQDFGKEIRENTARFAKEVLKKNKILLATQNVHYLKEEDKSAHKVLFNIHGEKEDLELYNLKFKNADYSFLDDEKMKKNFQDLLEKYNLDPVTNTKSVAEKCNLELKLGKWYFADISMDYQKELAAGKTFDDILQKLCYAGIRKRGHSHEDKELRERLNYELEVIKKKGFASYFLIVYDLLKYAKEHGILTNTRGSVAGSMTAYVLYVTNMNPLEYRLPFERFLNPERPSAPDIDMDFADDRREEVIEYVIQKYGQDKVAQIGTFGTMLARGAVKDTARALKYPYTLGDKISKLIPMPRQGFPVWIETALAEVEELKELYETDREVEIIIDMAKKIEGLARHVGVHAAGVLIAPKPIWEFTPIQYDPKGEGKIISQYDMYSATEDNAGLLKFDILGIRNLTILKTTIDLVKERYGESIDIEEINIKDKKTFELLAKGETVGLFQLNGSGMTKFLKELKPTSIFDINAMVALYRPGPIKVIPEYIERKHNPKLITYLDERLKDILEQSYGVIVYQDDVMMAAIKLGGYSWLDADKLRKAMGKKIPEVMESEKEKLIKGFLKNGLSKEKANEIWEKIAPFAAYGFNKAHAASYGRVAYQTAYMKANYPVAFLTAILTEESGQIEKISEIVAEGQRMKIKILPPNVNESFGGFKIFNDPTNETYRESIRFGLYTIKNLGTNVAETIISERERNGKYTSLEDFINRITHKDLNKKSLESLIKCGALDDLGERGQLIHNLDQILAYHKINVKNKMAQNSLFGAFSMGGIISPRFTLLPSPPATQEEKLNWEKELLGLYLSGNPLDKWQNKINNRNINIKSILNESNPEVQENKFISLPSWIESLRMTKTKQNEPMALLKVADQTGCFEVAVFPRFYRILKTKIILNTPLIIKGRIVSKNGEKTMSLEGITRLEE